MRFGRKVQIVRVILRREIQFEEIFGDRFGEAPFVPSARVAPRLTFGSP